MLECPEPAGRLVGERFPGGSNCGDGLPGHPCGSVCGKGPLVSDPPQQRRRSRYPVQIPMVYWKEADPQQRGAGWTHNLCDHGVGVELDVGLRPWLPLGLRLATTSGPLELRARVIWIGGLQLGGGTLHGLEFRQVRAPERAFLQEYVQLLQGQVRVGLRFPLTLPARCQPKSPPGPSFDGHTGNISRGGAMLALPQAVPVGSVLGVRISTAAGAAEVDGVIVWVDPPPKRAPGAPIRHGMEYVLLDWPTALLLAQVLAGGPPARSAG